MKTRVAVTLAYLRPLRRELTRRRIRWGEVWWYASRAIAAAVRGHG